jgi:hypothetical protein
LERIYQTTMATTEVIIIKGDSKGAVNAYDETKKAAKGTGEEAKKTNDAIEDGLSAIDKRTGGAVSAFKSMQKGLGGLATSFRTLGGAIAATGLGLLLLTITALTAAFTSSEEGQNKFAKIMGVIGAVTGNLVDILANLGESIISAFENPKAALESFGKLLQAQIMNRVTGLFELLPALGKAIIQAFSGDFTEAAATASNALGKVVLGVDDVVGKTQDAIDATKEFLAEQVKEGNAAAKVADMRAKAAKVERALLIERSVKEAEIAALRLKSRQEEEFTAEQRKAFIEESQKLEDELLSKEVEALELRRDAQILENTFSRTNIENLDKEAQAIAAVNDIQARRLTQQRATQRELNRVNKELAAEEKARLAEEQKAFEALQKAKIDAAENYRAYQQTLADSAYSMLLSDQEREIQAAQEKYFALIGLEELTAEERAKIAEKENAEIAAIEKKYADQRKAIEQQVADAKAAAANQSIDSVQNALSSLFGESKAVASANVVVDAAQAAVGIFKSSTSLPEPAASINRGIQLAALSASTIASIRQINAAEPGSATAAPATTAPTAPSAAPSFNVVGTSGINQLAQSIGQQNDKPVRAYVVGGDVTTSQELERKRIKTATFG